MPAGRDAASAAAFYDDLAAGYHLLYPDWPAACRDQGDALHALLAPAPDRPRLRVLDAAVGIGTQLLGLAAHGHLLVGTDVSAGAVRRAAQECASRGQRAGFALADMRALPFPDGTFDAVVCADNAVAHLMSAASLTRALGELARVARAGGRVLVTTRDYEDARRTHPTGTLPQVSPAGDVSFQLWHWREDGTVYDLEHVQLTGPHDAWRVTRRTASLWAVTRGELAGCAEDAGLRDGEWLPPGATGFFQPVFRATAGTG